MNEFKITYKWSENNNAINRSWQTDYAFITAKTHQQARDKFALNWTALNTDYTILDVQALL